MMKNKLLDRSNILLPEGVEFVNAGAGFSSMYTLDDTPMEFVELRVNGTPVLIQHDTGDDEHYLVGIGGAQGSLVSLDRDEISGYIRSRT